ncbi:MAG TPA: hypothetical protein PK605_02920 [Ignavibacteria bacterium]|nr:hypothetical protein [Ignavibacteria bacterium]HRF65632.1 hypothetical protein [Ignavibacteria bacterium]HRJ03336.1 hypothetical protein [Ignavibacteria bacterium]HRJ85993.1 hypothetical protein [Ignavibacteria bacterium]
MKIIFSLYTLLLLILIFSSCTTVYIPNEINAPAFNEPNQFKGGIAIGNSGTNLQLGFSFYKHFAAIGDISYLDRKSSEPRFQRTWSLGLGYFTRISQSDSMFYEVFGGYGNGRTNSAYEDQFLTNGPGYENADYNRYYITQNISFQQEFIDFIISVRLSYFSFTRYESHEFINPVMPQAIGVEPAIKIRIGGEFLKIKFQLGYNLINSIKGPDFNYDRSFGLIGLECSF